MTAIQEERGGEIAATETVEMEGNNQSAIKYLGESKKSGMKRARFPRGTEVSMTPQRQRKRNTDTQTDKESILPEEIQRIEVALKSSNPENIVTILRNHVRKSVEGIQDVAKIFTAESMPNVSLLPISQSDLNFLKLRCNNTMPNGYASSSLPQPNHVNIPKTKRSDGCEQLKHIMASLSLGNHFENLRNNGCESLADISVSDSRTLISLGMSAEKASKLISIARRFHPNLPSIEEVTWEITKDKENIATETQTGEHYPSDLERGEEISEMKEKTKEMMMTMMIKPTISALDDYKERER